jgi:microcystin degradation protein MlrC
MRIAIGGFLHETNTFAPSKATHADFAGGLGSGGMFEGAQIAERLGGTNIGIAGALATAEAEGWEVIPTLWTATSPSAHVTEDAFERIAAELVARITGAGRLDGVYLDLHGAMVTEHHDDGEGELLGRLREALGDGVPIVASLDLHANVTEAMVRHADLLESYRTYPHVDMAPTGARAARALARMVETGTRPAKAFRQAPYLTAISWQCTDLDPARRLYARVAALAEGLEGISLNMGFPAADFPDCGMSVTAYGEGANTAADTLFTDLLAAEPEFRGEILDPTTGVAEAMRLAKGASGPVILVDTQDNPGAGADSNTAGLLRAMVEAGAPGALGNLYDPDAARAAHEAGEGATLTLPLGGRSGVQGDAPFETAWRVERLTDGRVHATGPFHGGKVLNMGPSALLSAGPTRVVVVSGKAQMADREMFRTLGVEPEAEPILGIKSSVHFRADFAPIASAILVVKAPGPMAADPADLPWTRLRPGLRVSPLGRAF